MSNAFESLTCKDHHLNAQFKICCSVREMLIYIIERIIFVTMCCVLFGVLCTTMSVSDFEAMKKFKDKENPTQQNCEQLPLKVLKELHGPAFNPRYMSINKPLDNEENPMEPNDAVDRRRETNSRPSFYITEEHMHVLSDEPAWNIKWDTFREEDSEGNGQKRKKRDLIPIGVDANQLATQSTPLQRPKRQYSNGGRSEPWRCEKTVKWVHLGPDFHPSHLRTIECSKPKCYYGMFDCKPKKFEVRVLQRRRGACADAASLKVYGFNGKYAEVWEWTQISVNFCCDCVAPKSYY